VRRVVQASLFVAVAAMVLNVAQAQEVADCAEVAEGRMLEAGAASLDQQESGFYVHGESALLSFALSHAGCVAVVAQLAPGITRFELRLTTEDGLELARSADRPGHAYVRFCGAAGLSLTAVARVQEGQGELSLRAYGQAPPEFPLGQPDACLPAPRGIETVSTAVGPAPAHASAAERARRAAEFALDLGYELLWSRRLTGPDEETLDAEVDADRCYALHVSTDATMPALEVHADGVHDGGAWSRDSSVPSSDQAWLSVCPPAASAVSFSGGHGGRELSLFRLRGVRSEVPSVLQGDASMAYLELANAWQARGLEPHVMALGMAAPGETLRLPLTLERDGCFGFALVPTSELVGAVLRVQLLDAGENVLATSVSGVDAPMTYHCGVRGERIDVRARSESRDGRFLVVQGYPAVPSEAR